MDSNIEIENLELNEALEKIENSNDEVLWQVKTGLNSDTLCGAIETVIFMSDKPISIQKIKSLIDEEIPLKILHEAILRLQDEYEQKHHGLRLLEVAEGYQYRTKATYSKYVQDIFKVNSLVLSPTALEVLAIIAYKQPVSKVEVDKIRGVDSGHIVRALMDKRLVKVNGRSEELGRPVLYGTTPEFLEVFNLPDLSAMPKEHELDEMSRASTVGKIADIKTLVHEGDKAKFKFDEFGELDELSESIKQIASETDFTSSLKVEEKKRLSPEGHEIKSAYDLLEEFINKKQVSDQNKISVQSQLMTNLLNPSVISDLEAGPFNVPLENEFEEDHFEMIDLNTGLPITDIDENTEYENHEVNLEDFDFLVDLDLSTEVENEEEIKLEYKTEAESLSKALDEAFLQFSGEKLEERYDEPELTFQEDNEENDILENKTNNLDQLTEQMIEKGNDLDLDLSFLKK